MKVFLRNLVLTTILIVFIGLHFKAVAQSSAFSVSASTVCAGSPVTFVGTPACSSITNSLNIAEIGTTNASLLSTATSNITMEAWIKWNQDASNSASRSIFYNGNTAGTGYGIYLSYVGGLRILAGGTSFINTTATLTPGIWQHVAITNSGGTWYLYLNGAQYSTGSTLVPATPTTGAYVGCNNGGTEKFDGDISNVAFWSVARSASQIQADMQSCSISGSGLVAYWSLNNTNIDGSGNGNTLSLSNTSYTTDVPVMGASYAWDFGDGNTASVGSVTNTYTYMGSYTASLTVTYNGSSTTTTHQITVNPTPTASISGASAACGYVKLTASGGGTYSWTTGSSLNTDTNTISVSSRPVVTVTNSYGCSSTAAQSITITPLTVAGTVSSNQIIVAGSVGVGTTTVTGEQNTSASSLANLRSSNSIAQSFIPSSNVSFSLTSVIIKVAHINIAGSFTLKILSGNGTGGTVLSTQSVTISTTGLITLNLTTPLSLTSGQAYTLVLSTTGTGFITCYYYSTSNVYANGNLFQNGSAYVNYDLYFQLNYQVPNANWNNLTLSGNTGSILYWQEATNSNFSNPTTISNTTTTIKSALFGNLSANTYFRAVVESGSCGVLNTNIVAIIMDYAWTGAISTDWSDSRNWSNNAVPTSSNSALIAASLANEPSLGTDVTLSNITLNGSLAINGHTLTLNGAVTGTGNFKGSATSSLVVGGIGGTLNFNSTANSLQNLTITSGSVTLGNTLNIYGTFTPTAGTFNTGGYLTLRSKSIANTAVVGIVGGIVNGTVTVERYIPNGKRTYRDLGCEVTNAGSVFNNWQEGGINTNGYGIQITGSQGSIDGIDPFTGFDYSFTGNRSLYTYSNNTWTPITTTKGTNLNPYQGYRVLVRGDRTGTLQTQLNGYMWSPATIRAKGNLITGTVAFSNLTGGIGSCSFVANPYVSPVDWDAVVTASTGINGTYWYCDPTFTTDSGYTTFVAYNNSTGVSNPLGLSNVNRYLQLGQAFFVENETTSPSLVFTEACKVPAQGKTAIFGATTSLNRIAVGLYRDNANIDGAATVFNSGFSNAIGKEDAIKFPNGGENLAIAVAGKDLCINGYSLPTSSDVLPIHLYNLQANTAYTIRLDASQYTGSGVSAFIKDNVANTQTLLAGDNTSLAFTTKTSDASSYANRYSIVFGASPLPVREINVTAAVQSNEVLVKWITNGEHNVANYYVEHSANGTDFTDLTSLKADNTATANYSYVDAAAKQGNNYYRIKAVDNTGSVSYSAVVIATIGKPKGAIGAYPNPVIGNSFNLQLSNLEGGNYTIRIISKLGQEVFAKGINHIAGSSSEHVSMHSLAAGTYTVRVANGNGTAYQTQIEVK